MTPIRFAVDRDGIAGVEPNEGQIRCVPTKRRNYQGTVILPDAFAIDVRADQPAPVVALTPSQPGWAWHFSEQFPGSRGIDRYCVVPDTASIVNYANLADVKKDTLEPDVEPEAAWWAQAQQTYYATPDPNDPDIVIIHGPAHMVDANDPNILHIPVVIGG